MKTIETRVYEFDELSPKAKEVAREWMRRCNDGDSYWSESVIEDADQCAELIGIEFAKHDVKLYGGGTRQYSTVYWSGFSSQGDGACFEGNWRASQVKPGALQQHAPKDETLHRIAAEFERIAKLFPQASFSVKHSGHYSHDGCTDFDVRIVDNDDNEIETPEAEKANEDLIEVARDFMKWIYRQLETEWDYQNADEQVDESIRANEYTFTEDGKRF